jgi:hypothetical protein
MPMIMSAALLASVSTVTWLAPEAVEASRDWGVG